MTIDQTQEAKRLFLKIREYSSYGYAKCCDADKADPILLEHLLNSIANEMEFVIRYSSELEALQQQIFLLCGRRKQIESKTIK